MSTTATRQKNLMDQHQQREITIPTINDPQTNTHDRQQQQPLKPVLDLRESAAPPRMMPKSASNQALPTKKRGVLNRFESVPQDGWKMIKKWVGNYRQQSKKQQLQSIASIERQAEYNTLGPLLMAMHFSRDEDDKKRIPVFFDNLTVKVSKLETHKKGTVFNIRVQYGTGANKVTWSVYRRYWDFVKLHYRYKKKYSNSGRRTAGASGEGYIASRQRTKLPKFPSLPRKHFRKQRKRDFERGPMSRQETSVSIDTSDYATNPASLMDEDAVMAMAAPIAEEDESAVAGNNNAHRPSAARMSAPSAAAESTTSMSSQVMDVVKADRNVLQAFETYLNQFITSIGPLGYVNRLCKFLEISALGLALAAKYPSSYHHGKEGFVVFQSRTDRDPKQSRKFLQDGLVCSVPTTGGRRRRKPKWFIVRESYVVCVDDPSEVCCCIATAKRERYSLRFQSYSAPSTTSFCLTRCLTFIDWPSLATNQHTTFPKADEKSLAMRWSMRLIGPLVNPRFASKTCKASIISGQRTSNRPSSLKRPSTSWQKTPFGVKRTGSRVLLPCVTIQLSPGSWTDEITFGTSLWHWRMQRSQSTFTTGGCLLNWQVDNGIAYVPDLITYYYYCSF